jgi:hypothetical protein
LENPSAKVGPQTVDLLISMLDGQKHLYNGAMITQVNYVVVTTRWQANPGTPVQCTVHLHTFTVLIKEESARNLQVFTIYDVTYMYIYKIEKQNISTYHTTF